MKGIQVRLFDYEWEYIERRIREEECKGYFREIWKRWGWELIFRRGDRFFWEFYRYRMIVDRGIREGIIRVDDDIYTLYEFVGRMYGVGEGNIMEYCIRREVTGDSGGGVVGLAA